MKEKKAKAAVPAPSESWITEEDVYLYGRGEQHQSYRKFGAHLRTVEGVTGVQFAVWAPNARDVSVIGDFNQWKRGTHWMYRVKNSGIWELFIPGLGEGEIYKYAITTPEGHPLEKADPYAFGAELRPRTGSVVTNVDGYDWADGVWLANRAQKDFLHAPMSVYEVHPGSWKKKLVDGQWKFMGYREMAETLVSYVKEQGFTHIELMGICEHPLDMSWGYQALGYFAPTSRFGSPKDFMFFVDKCHQNGIGVILDWVPAHFPKDDHGLNGFDGRQIYAYEDWKKAEHKDWGTLVFDYGRSEVRNFLTSSALFWLDYYHIDGIRVDAVASMIYLDYSRKYGEWNPNVFGGNENLEAIDFVKRWNEVLHQFHPGVLTIAEESTAYGGVSRPTYLNGLGFSMKWNMGWMHDGLKYFQKDPIHRQFHQNELTFSMIYAFHENFVLPISHDEVVYGKQSLLSKMPGDEWQQLANYRLFLGYMYTHPGKKLLFMGQEFGQAAEWNYDQSLDWHVLQYDRHKQAQLLVRDLNHLYVKSKAMHERDFDGDGFEWIDFNDGASSILSYVRWSKQRDEMVIVVCNMTPTPRPNYRIGVPKAGYYEEILNTDSKMYGGSDVGNFGGLVADAVGWHGRPFSLNLNIPPLACVVFRHVYENADKATGGHARRRI